MLDFVEANFQFGFKKALRNTRIPRVRFEAISVGVALALRARPDLQVDPATVAEWAYGPEFTALVTSDGANSRPRIAARIEFVRDRLVYPL